MEGVPLNVKRPYTGMGDSASSNFINILIYPDKKNTFVYYHLDTKVKTTIICNQRENEIEINLNGKKIPHILRIHSAKAPKEIILDGIKRDALSWKYNKKVRKIVLITTNYKKRTYIIKL